MPTRDLVLEGARHQAWSAFLIVAAIVAATCLVLLYRFECRLLPQRLGLVLLGLRLAAAGVLILALLEPQWTTTYTRETAGGVRVAVDVSPSMESADRSLSDAEALRLARALGMIGNAATAAELDAWIAALEANRDPGAIATPDADADQHADLLADSRRTLLQVIRDELATLPRTEIVRRLLLSGQTTILNRLASVGPIQREVFADSVSPAAPDDFAASILTPPESLPRTVTDLSQPLSAGDDEPLTAIVLLTDGRDTAGHNAAALVASAKNAGAPIYPVLIGSTQRPKDLAVTTIDAPASVFVNDRPAVRVGLRTSGFGGVPIEITIADADGGETIETQSVVPAGETAEARFDLPANSLGRRRYTVTVRTRPGESRTDNNSRNFSLQVVDDRVRVLVLDGDPRWEFRYLVAALERDQRVELTAVLFRQPYLGLLPDTFFQRDLPTPPSESTDNLFDQFDAILLGDVAPQQLSPVLWDQLAEHVRDSAGTLVLMAGKQHMPREYQSEKFLDLLPVEDLEVIEALPADALRPPDERGFRVQVTPDGDATGVLVLDGIPAKNLRIWDGLPGHTWGLRGRAKPGSTVWATAIRNEEDPDLSAEREAAVIVERNVGAGRVVWIGIDSTWRWRSRVGDEYHHRFWGQLVRSAAEFKAAAHTDVVQFGPERPEVQSDEAAVFRARWSEAFARQNPDLAASVELTQVDPNHDPGTVTMAMRPADGRAQEWEARLTGLAPGEYRARLLVENAEADLDEAVAELIVQQNSSPELNDVTADPTLLEQIAQASGGQLLLPDQLRELPDILRGGNVSEEHRETTPLWNHWSLLALFCGLLGTEWVLRKLNGLP